MISSCAGENQQTISDENETESKLCLHDSLKQRLSFSYTVYEEYNHDNLSLFKPKMETLRTQDSIILTISYIESGSPTLEGGFELDKNTLVLTLLDIYPEVSCSCEEFYVSVFKIPEKDISFDTVVLKRIYNNRIIRDTLLNN
ncbi:hypothetical protein K6119_04270 [Paracrocinitomix mangrovi]|uniref:hypothetical protein n=1 Tax=Paracrocinitomix mangrovi TaxID=2862509 RepID=UPI001C8EA074|nr:hypothetical protein [Paracrocinitomix mangrovi]UKN02729.1 hypothetical protein K6119_04270 [Paracrocinitomix mangrovi]